MPFVGRGVTTAIAQTLVKHDQKFIIKNVNSLILKKSIMRFLP